MHPTLTIVLGICSTSALLVVMHFCYLVSSKPKRLLELRERYKNTNQMNFYCALLAIGWFTIAYGGTKLLLFWMPASWGGIDEDGDFSSIRDYISIFLSLYSLVILISLEKSAQETES